MFFNRSNKLWKHIRFVKVKAVSIDEFHNEESFWNHTFDKGRLKSFVLWFLKQHGEHKTIHLVEELKSVGFHYATKAGISLGVEDLKIPEKKYSLMMDAELLSVATIKQYKRGEITGVERFQRLIDTWHRTSERLKQEVVDNFEATDVLNPVYMMAFSGARGNISQVRQLVGMRGLMSDPQGQIIDFPIRSNFREGLTLTEYIISSYGARKGIVDTALRTANAGYLTRRLVDVAQHVIISCFDCGTKRGIFLTDMKEGNKVIYSLQNRLIGRVLARDVFDNQKHKIASRNIEINLDLANNLASTHQKIFVRSALTCATKKLVCQLCYGWSLAQGNLVPIGEAVGVVAAQSIGEPGTQLTMRTFHTGGVFSGDVSDQIRSPFNGIVEYESPIAGTLIRTPEGKIAFLTKNEGSFVVHRAIDGQIIEPKESKRYKIPFYTLLFLKNGSMSHEKEVIAQISSINRQKNATDQVELTIKSELSGQFYSKFLDLKENKVGPKLKSTENSNDTLSTQFNENAVDVLFEAWGWGYAWVLSGKIYQIGLPTAIFPILGDFVNQKTFMNQIKWNLPTSFGSSFNLNLPELKKLFNDNALKSMRKFSNQDGLNSALLKNNQLVLLKNQLISFQLSNIIYQKIGYFLKLCLPETSFNVSLNSISNKPKSNLNSFQSIFSPNDTLFLLSSLSSSSSGIIQKTLNSNSNSNNDNEISVYPADWRPGFDVFVNWFPKRFTTKTAGLTLVEPIIFNPQSTLPKSVCIKNKNKMGLSKYRNGATLRSNFSKKYRNSTYFFWNLKSHFKKCDLFHFSEKFIFENSFKIESSIDSNIQTKIPFFPSFIRKDVLLKFSNKLNSSSQEGVSKISSVTPFLNSKPFSVIKNSRDFKSLSYFSQSLIFEQYSKNSFGTLIYNEKNSGKNKSKSFNNYNFSLMWKNPFKVNLNQHLFSNFKNQKTNSQLKSMKALNKKMLQDFGRFFWVPQPFYSICSQKLKKIFFGHKTKIKSHLNANKSFSNGFFHSNLTGINESPIFYQINHQGTFEPFYFNESLIQTYQNLSIDPLLLKNLTIFKNNKMDSMNSKYKNYANFCYNQNSFLNKLSAYKFFSFNSKLKKELKARKEELFCESNGPLFSHSKKDFNRNINDSKLLTLKSFSKMASIPYFLNKKASVSFKKYIDKKNRYELPYKQKVQKKPSLFKIYFYSLFNKYWSASLMFQNNLDNKVQTLLNSPLKQNQFKHICSFYFKDQILFSDFNDQQFNESKNMILSNKFKKQEQYQLKFYYNKQINRFSYYLENNKLNLNDKKSNDLHLFFNKIIFKKMAFERTTTLNKWVKTSIYLRKKFIKNLFKLNRKLYRTLLKIDPSYKNQKSIFLKQTRKLYPLLKKLTSRQKSLIKNKNKNKNKGKNKKANLNILSKSGWVYYPRNLSDFFLYHKKLVNFGKHLTNDLNFISYPVYIEIISFNQIQSSSVFDHKSQNKTKTNGFKQIHHMNFKITVKNNICRFKPKNQNKFDTLNPYFVLIRKTKEHKLINNLDQKKQLWNFANQISIGPALSNLELEKEMEFKPLNFKNLLTIANSIYDFSSDSIKFNRKLLNKGFNSLNVYLQYKTALLNKQQSTSQTISKYPAADFSLISNSFFYIDACEFSLKKPNNYEIEFSKFNQSNFWGLPYFESNSIKPINFLPIIISYCSPYSFNFPFKVPLHLFSQHQDKFFLSFNKKSKIQSNLDPEFKNILYHYILKIDPQHLNFSKQKNLKLDIISLSSANYFHSNLSAIFCCPIAEYSLGSQFEKSISIPNLLLNSNKNTVGNLIWNLNHVGNKRLLKGKNGMVLGSLNGSFEFANQRFKNNEVSLYKTDFESFIHYGITSQVPFLKTSMYCSFEGELIYKTLKSQKLTSIDSSVLNLEFEEISSNSIFDQKSADYGCMILTKSDQICFYLNSENYKQAFFGLENLKKKNQYMIDNIVINFLNVSEKNLKSTLENDEFDSSNKSKQNMEDTKTQNRLTVQINKLHAGMSQQKNKLLIGECLVYGDQICPNLAIPKSGQIIHLNHQKVTLRRGQPISVSPKAVLYKYDGDFIEPQSSVLTLTYQQLKTGDIIQGIPKVEQFFEARTTKRGRLFRDSLSNLLKGLFKRYRSKLPFDQAVRQSFYKIQQIIVDGVQRVYRSQGVTIADKHLEVIVKQMTSKVRIIEGGQTGFFPGEVVDLDLVENVNRLLMKKIIYEPLVLGITKSSLEVDSFLSAASFQQTTRVLSKAAIFRKKDFLKGLKENVILGNLIPAGTGYLVYLDPID